MLLRVPYVSIGLWAALLFNLSIIAWRIMWNSSRASGNNVSYSYIGDDFPLYYPIGELGTVAITLQETVRLDLNLTDAIANEEWLITNKALDGFGRTRLGPENRMFVVAFYHELHCLLQIRTGILSRDDPTATTHHMRHCFDYLRQLMLCEAADMLEEGDFMAKNLEEDRVGSSLVCKDWERVYEVLGDNFEHWTNWSKTWN